MICHADSDDDDDLIMSRVVIEIVMNPMCWKSGDGNCDGWKRVLTVFVHFSHSTPPLLQRWQSTQLSDQSIFLSLWSLIAMKTRTLMKLMTTIPSFTPEPAEHQSPPPSTTTLDEVFHHHRHHHLQHQHHRNPSDQLGLMTRWTRPTWPSWRGRRRGWRRRSRTRTPAPPPATFSGSSKMVGVWRKSSVNNAISPFQR